MKSTVVHATGFAQVRQHPDLLKMHIARKVHHVINNALYKACVPLEARLWIMGKFLKWSPICGGSIGDTAENDILKLIFNATAIANIADNAASGPLTNLYVSLHTANPGDSGNQTTSESAYTSYARVAVARSTGGWTASTVGSTSPVATITFPAATGGSETATYFAVGTASSGTGKVLWSGPISPTISISNGVTPSLTTSSSLTLD